MHYVLGDNPRGNTSVQNMRREGEKHEQKKDTVTTQKQKYGE